MQKLQLLLQKGADASFVTSKNVNVFDIFDLNDEDENEQKVIVEMVQLLIKHNSDWNRKKPFYDTLLRRATMKLQLHLMEMLVKLGADIFEISSSKRKPLIHDLGSKSLSTKSKPFVKCLKVLLDNGLDINVTDFDGNTILHDTPIIRKCNSIAKVILRHGGKVNHKNHFGYTPLHFPYVNGDFKGKYKIKHLMLMKNGTDLNTRTIDGIDDSCSKIPF